MSRTATGVRLYLTGPAGAGKSTAAGLLQSRGASVYRLSDMLRDRQRQRERAWLQGYADRLRQAFGPHALAQAAHLAALCDAAPFVVIEGVRLPEEAAFLAGQGYVGLRLDAPAPLRHRRLLERDRRPLSAAEAAHPTERAVPAVPVAATIWNDGTLTELGERLAGFLAELAGVSAGVSGPGAAPDG